MHAVTFQLKRAHLSSVGFGRKVFEHLGAIEDARGHRVQLMTPARFDILYVIYKGDGTLHPDWRMTVAQSWIRKMLGLHDATISKGVTRLIELDLVCVRHNLIRDRRNRVVSLTERGMKLLRQALEVIFKDQCVAKKIGDFVWPTEQEERAIQLEGRDPRLPKKKPLHKRLGQREKWWFLAAVTHLYKSTMRLAQHLGDQSVGLWHPHHDGFADRQLPEKLEERRKIGEIRRGPNNFPRTRCDAPVDWSVRTNSPNAVKFVTAAESHEAAFRQFIDELIAKGQQPPTPRTTQ